ncbi:MAG: hypothetical protein KBS61_07595, partial [Chryseobacterium sp.]|nr:hypothetical protein [Candidatus Chryseobacterium enterohippi]
SFFATLILATIVGIVQSYFVKPSQSKRICYMPFFTETLTVALALVVALSTITIFFNLNVKIRKIIPQIFYRFSFSLLLLVSLQ